MCKVLGVSVSGFYSWKYRPSSKREIAEKRLLKSIQNIHQKSRKTYGSPRIYRSLKNSGENCSKVRVAKIMKKHGIRSKIKRKYKVTTDSKHSLPVAKNLLKREFSPETPNSSWSCDITYLWTKEGWLYLAVVMDLYSRKIIGWNMNKRMTKDLVEKALIKGVRNRKSSTPVLVHSDRGSQYASYGYQGLLKLYGVQCSMSRKGNCWDNAPVESFFGTLKREHTSFEDYKTREEAKQSVFEWIEVFYNRQRLHSTLGYLSPEEYERKTLVA